MFFLKTNENDCNFWSTTSWLAITTVLFWNFPDSLRSFFGLLPKKDPILIPFLAERRWLEGKINHYQIWPVSESPGKELWVTKQHPRGAFPTWLPWPPKKKWCAWKHTYPFQPLVGCLVSLLLFGCITRGLDPSSIFPSNYLDQWIGFPMDEIQVGHFWTKTSPDTFHVQKNEEFSLLSCKAYRKNHPPPKQKWRRSGTERKPSILGWSALYCMVHAWSHAKWLVNCRRTRKICLTHTIRVRYIDLHENHKNQPNVSNYTIHGWYG